MVAVSLLAVDAGSTQAQLANSAADAGAVATTLARSALPAAVAALPPLPTDRSATEGSVPFAAAPPRSRKPSAAIPVGATDGVPAVAIAAYLHAQKALSSTDPGCHLSWEDVAGIGRVESDNGQTWGAAARVTSNGTLFPPILGIPLDGSDGTPAMPAAGGGWIRAEGPMQFLPATWAEYAQDGNGDGQRNPQNFYDAALTTGAFLCANGGNLATAGGLVAAITAYNHSSSYVSLVQSWISFYGRVGVQALRAAGNGLLPTGSAPVQSVAGANPAGVLASAALASEAAGSYSFSLRGLAGSSLIATGRGAVDTGKGTAWLTLQLPGSGPLQLRLIKGVTYASLPTGLATDVGADTSWILLTPTALRLLPSPFRSGLAIASADLRWLVGQLSGTSDVHIVGRGRSGGAAAIEYAGDVNFAQARKHLPGATTDLKHVSVLLGSWHLQIEAWVAKNRIRSAVISLGRFVAGEGPISLHLTFSGYGHVVSVIAPPVSSTSPPTTTTTTSTTTSTSTTTTTTTTPTTTTTTLPPS
jgi:membrane-bound lytic murein transglycosylase B